MARKTKDRKEVVVLREPEIRNQHSIALPVADRRLSFGDKWNYAPAPEANNYIQLKLRYQHFIDGKFVAPHSGK